MTTTANTTINVKLYAYQSNWFVSYPSKLYRVLTFDLPHGDKWFVLIDIKTTKIVATQFLSEAELNYQLFGSYPYHEMNKHLNIEFDPSDQTSINHYKADRKRAIQEYGNARQHII